MDARTRRTLWIVLGVVLLVAAGVGISIANSNDARDAVADGDGGAESTAASGNALSTEPPLAAQKPDTSYTTPPPADGPTPEDGLHFSYINDVYAVDGSTVLVVDYAQLLTGTEAAAAATAAGAESPPPNDYFIVNENTLLRTFPVDTTINVRLTSKPDGVQPEGYEVTFDEWRGMFSGSSADTTIVRSVPYWITVEGGAIKVIEEQYLP